MLTALREGKPAFDIIFGMPFYVVNALLAAAAVAVVRLVPRVDVSPLSLVPPLIGASVGVGIAIHKHSEHGGTLRHSDGGEGVAMADWPT